MAELYIDTGVCLTFYQAPDLNIFFFFFISHAYLGIDNLDDILDIKYGKSWCAGMRECG